MSQPSAAAEAAAQDPDKSLPVVDAVTDYEKLYQIGEGTYGVVYKARDKRTGELVALKKVRFDRSREGVPVTSLRELRVLQQCRHANVVTLKKVVTGSRPDSVFLVFEYCEHDLARLLDTMPRRFSTSEVKCLILQLLQGISYLHDRWVMHRDLKLSNLLYNRHGTLKLCDFGLARYFQPFEAPVTPRVVTLWYRAPEVLLGSEAYAEAIDMWAVGCILAELLQREPLFPAATELECLQLHCRLLGAPTDESWPGLRDLPGAQKVQLPQQQRHNYLPRSFPELSPEGLHLLQGLLTWDPEQRLTARQALRHPWFQEKPMPQQPSHMPTFPSTHPDGLRRPQAPAPPAAVHHHTSAPAAPSNAPANPTTTADNNKKRPPPLEAVARYHDAVSRLDKGAQPFRRWRVENPDKQPVYRGYKRGRKF